MLILLPLGIDMCRIWKGNWAFEHEGLFGRRI